MDSSLTLHSIQARTQNNEIPQMQNIIVHFAGGGPLDGITRDEQLPDHWRLLRVEKRSGNKLHVYAGPVGERARTVTLTYLGAERIEVNRK